ncbi:MAG: molybdate ABC transporter substrate-binding protein [Planctomycetaceae bacterium]|nr:molybdate ABC transporter substrate-binding protein [Planctomycetaceae bacterium]
MISTLVALFAIASAPQADLTVLAAASLKAPLNEIARQFETKHPDVRVQISFAGSQELATQINLGAPADAFFSADRAQMDVVVKSGKVEAKQVQPFAANHLTLLVSKSAADRIKGLGDLGQSGVKICMAGEKVPVGAYTREMLKKASAKLGDPWLAQLQANTVSLETNVSAVVSRVELDEVDAGFVYQTDAIQAKKSISRTIPKEWNVRAQYFVAVPKESKLATSAKQFVALVLGREGQTILARYGFLPPK